MSDIKLYELFFEAVLLFLLIGGLWGEYDAITENTSRAKAIQSEAQAPGFTVCNMIGSAAQFNASSNYAASITWRRSMIGAVCIAAIVPPFLNMKFTVMQRLGLVLLGYLAITSIEGYFVYHFTNITAMAVDTNLQLAIRAQDQTECNPAYTYASLSRRLGR